MKMSLPCEYCVEHSTLKLVLWSIVHTSQNQVSSGGVILSRIRKLLHLVSLGDIRHYRSKEHQAYQDIARSTLQEPSGHSRLQGAQGMTVSVCVDQYTISTLEREGPESKEQSKFQHRRLCVHSIMKVGRKKQIHPSKHSRPTSNLALAPRD